ncbi:hypothetical protein [Litoribaculum gwangyangense]|uniref:HEPN AbiU2-like domain-containing protein n=1 Tax=Litoribaculum gwangyangense TaxID=1130722 RepID=A0ABP9CPU9_9FLAO
MKESIIEKQIGILRTILGDLAENDKNGDDDFIEFTNRYFCFDTNFGWNILMNAFYVFEDTELAKSDFEKFGLQGPSRYKNTGEKYLRLYGALNSFYQQNLALINLVKLFHLSPEKEIINQLKDLDCIKLRNKIAAHSTNYSTDLNNKGFDVYEISRPELERGKIRLLKNHDIFETYLLDELIEDFNKKVQEILSEILKKFIKKKFKNQGKHFEEFIKLEKLRNGAIEFGNTRIEFKNN